MINLNLNLDSNQPVQFNSFQELTSKVLSNPHKYDGLCLMSDSNEVLIELCYVECYDNWEVSENDGVWSTSYDYLEKAVEAFIMEVNQLII